MKKIFTIPLLLTGTLLLGGCSLYGAQPSSPAPATSSVPAQGSTAVASNAVDIQNFSFTPSTLTIKKGTTVTWTNNDSTPHQIKSATFNSGQLSKGQTFSFTFADAGTFAYSCAIHPSMTGTIVVE